MGWKIFVELESRGLKRTLASKPVLGQSSGPGWSCRAGGQEEAAAVWSWGSRQSWRARRACPVWGPLGADQKGGHQQEGKDSRRRLGAKEGEFVRAGGLDNGVSRVFGHVCVAKGDEIGQARGPVDGVA